MARLYTYLLGEKNLDPNHYLDCEVFNDDQSMYNGYDQDTIRGADNWTPGFGSPTDPPNRPPVPDTPGRTNTIGISEARTRAAGSPCSVTTRCDT